MGQYYGSYYYGGGDDYLEVGGMTKDKHTAGPWAAIHELPDEINIIHKDNSPGAIRSVIAKIKFSITWRSEAKANARLIAAAPDLLEALEKIAARISVDGQKLSPICMANIARTATAKARGK